MGDTHGDWWTIRNVITRNKLSDGDRLFICGDFGFIWSPEDTKYEREENVRLGKINDFGVEVLFIDGNHENFERLYKFPEIEKYGGMVGQIRENIFHLKRGYVYEIDGKKIFTMGGGVSIDRVQRKEGFSWWPEEMHSKAEQDFAMDNLDKANWEVDFIITHSAPMQAEPMIKKAVEYSGRYGMFKLNALHSESQFHTMVYDKIKFQEWHFGHYHEEAVDGQFYLHYDRAVKFF